MKIYFAASIRGGRDDADFYRQLIGLLGKYGTVLTEHFGDADLTAATGTGGDVKAIYKQDMAWIREADVVVAEVSTPSLGVGYEIGQAEILGKPILGLYRPKVGRSLSAMITGAPGVTVREYSDIQAVGGVLQAFFRNF